MLTSAACGLIVGYEREIKDKPVGMRTLALISLGSCVFTIASILMAAESPTDRTRIAAQIVTGIGFLGAGAIIRDRGTVVGMTTGATVWMAAAIGLLIGAGYAVPGVLLTLLVLVTLTIGRRFERHLFKPCRFTRCQVLYRPERGRTRLLIQQVLDRCRVRTSAYQVTTEGELERIDIRYCDSHAQHRAFLYRLVKLPGVEEFRTLAPDDATDPTSSKP